MTATFLRLYVPSLLQKSTSLGHVYPNYYRQNVIYLQSKIKTNYSLSRSFTFDKIKKFIQKEKKSCKSNIHEKLNTFQKKTDSLDDKYDQIKKKFPYTFKQLDTFDNKLTLPDNLCVNKPCFKKCNSLKTFGNNSICIMDKMEAKEDVTLPQQTENWKQPNNIIAEIGVVMVVTIVPPVKSGSIGETAKAEEPITFSVALVSITLLSEK